MPRDAADDDLRVFRRSDPDFPTTRAVQQRLVDAGCVEGRAIQFWHIGLCVSVCMSGGGVTERLYGCDFPAS